MLFGGAETTKPYENDPRVELHGPGYSKVLLGPDAADEWEQHLDVMVGSIAANGGRSCINASGVWTPKNGAAIARALAERLVAIVPRAMDDPDAAIAPFADPRVAAHISGQVDLGLEVPGATEVTAALRNGPRLVQHDGSTYLLPTVIHCTSPDHPLANREFLFPFASVVEVPIDDVPAALGPTLVVTALTNDDGLTARLLGSHLIGRLNLGPIQTNAIAWDQPHEGNLFEHLYGRRACQRAG